MLRLHLTISLDGYVAGPNQSLDHPMGEGAQGLHAWAIATRTFRAMHGMAGGETGPDDDIAAESFRDLGATIMGRHMFGGGDGPWPEPAWNGWWDEEPPYHTPVFVLTHFARPPLEMLGGTTFHFVTDGIQAALERAQAAAGDKDVAIGGGADVARQYLAAGLVDEMELHVAPVLLGAGERLFETADLRRAGHDFVRVVASPAVTHYKIRCRR